MSTKLFSVTKKDFTLSYYSGSGGGGQNRNKHKNCVRIQHKSSGAMVSNCTQKNLHQNKKLALGKLKTNKLFLDWIKVEAAKYSDMQRLIEKRVDEEVERAMDPKNIKVEYL